MEYIILTVTLILGLLLGSIMLCTVLYVYIKRQIFGMGGSVLTTFGVLLLGLSLWKSVEVSVTSDGGIQAKFEALEKVVKKENEQTSERLNTLTEKTSTISQNSQKEYSALVEIDNSLPDKVGAVCTTSKLLNKELFVMSANRHRAIGVIASGEFPCLNPDSPIEILRINKKYAEYLYGTVPESQQTSAIIDL